MGGKAHFFSFTLETFRRIMASYALLAAFPLLVSSLIYVASIARIDRDTEEANRVSLSLLAEAIDSRLAGMASVADQVSVREDVKSIVMASPPVSVNQRLTMSEVQSFLYQASVANQLVASIYLYIPGTDYVLSSVSRYQGDEFDDVALRDFGLDRRGFVDLMLSEGYRRFVALPAGRTNPGLVFIQNLYFEGFGQPSAAVAIRVDETKLRELVRTIKGERQVSLALSLPAGVWRLEPEGPSPTWAGYETLPSTFRNSDLRSERGRLMLSSIGSAKADLRYISVIPYDIYRGSIRFVRRIAILYVCLSLVGILFLSYAMAKRNYSPLHRIASLFHERLSAGSAQIAAKQGTSEALPGRDDALDFGFLEASLERLLKQHTDLENTIERQRESLRSTILARMLRAHPAMMDRLLDEGRATGLELGSGRWILVAASVGSVTAKPAGSASRSEPESLIRYMAWQVLEELFGARYAARATDLGGVTVCWVGLGQKASTEETREGAVEEIVSVCDVVRRFFREKFDAGLSFAVGTVREAIVELPAAMAELDRVIDYMRLFEREDATVIADAIDSGPLPLAPGGSRVLERVVAERLSERDFDGAADALTSYLEGAPDGGPTGLESARLRMSTAATVVIELLSDLRLNGGVSEVGRVEIDGLARAASVPELERRIRSLFGSLSEGQSRVVQEEGLGRSVARHVELNSADINLCVNSIAVSFGLSVPHLSRTFKRDMGIGLLDYIHLVRVREAKRLLADGSLHVEEIARRVGCGSRVTLVRAFKRYEGVAPAAFRELDDKSDNSLQDIAIPG